MDVAPMESPSSVGRNVGQEALEKALAENVKFWQMEVERLEREVDAFRTHCTFLFDSFSIPTYPLDDDPVTERVGVGAVLPENSDGNDASKAGKENDTLPSSHAPESAGFLEQHQSPSPTGKDEVGFADEADQLEEVTMISPVRNPVSIEVLSSSTSASSSKGAKNAMDWSRDDDVDQLKDKIRRNRPGVKSPRKSPAKPNGRSIKISEKDLETGTSSDDNSGFSDEESSGEEDPSSKADESSSEEDSAIQAGESSSEEDSASEAEESCSEGDSTIKADESSSEEDSASEAEESCSEEGSASKAEESSSESDGIKLDFRSNSREMKRTYSDPEEISSPSSIASECLMKQKPSPVNVEKTLSGERKKASSKPRARTFSSSSDDSEESSSSSDEDTERNNSHAQAGRSSLGRARESIMPKAVSTLSLSSDASPEDLFDWMILGLQGPWHPMALDGNASGGSELKDQSVLPLKFPLIAAYVATFQKLIGEEARAILLSEWEQYKAAQDSSSMSLTQSSLEYSYSEDSRAQSSSWQLRSMVQTMGDPFHYFEAEWKAGPKVKFNAGEFLCMLVPGTNEVKAVALINNHDRYQAPLLRTRAPWNSSFDTCVLMRLCNMVTLRRMFLAVSTISEIFSPLKQQILDPVANIEFLRHQPAHEDAGDSDVKMKLSSESLRNFSDQNILNTLQLLTVSCLLQMRQGFQLVQGPPGTGKTSTIVGMVSALLIEEPGIRILVCAPSNAALDEVAARLVHRMVDKTGYIYSPMDGAIVRFGSKRVMHPLVQLISLDNLTLRLSSSSRNSRSWVDILDGASVVCATLSGCGSTTFDELKKKFDVIIIDEAAQAVEAEVLIALKRVRGRCVMVGDPQQLPATVFQRPSTAYGRSLFERFQEGGVPVCMLTNQYRMHPSISLYPSQKFYGGALKNSGRTCSMQSIFSVEVCGRGMNIRGCKFKLGHYCFMDVGWGIEREELIGHSRANYEEALVVCNIVEGVVKGLLPDHKPNVGVITPYIAQRGVIEDQLWRRGIDSAACEVNTVDGFQGREKDVIVLSCVRAMADRGLGFVSDEKRMNVALTRAKYSLIIVGHAETLQKWSPAWGSLIEDARKRDCYQVLTNNNNQDISQRKRKQSYTPQKNLCGVVKVESMPQPSGMVKVENQPPPPGMVKLENIPQHSGKRTFNCTEGERPHKRPHKKMGYSKPNIADTRRR
ncbi:hypothetical protein KC19_5G098200 [Ceratodon purpureus]|uniref:Uncharacterized protein n=1 Tax=Ceratodon purpureus TaxID=3225 RepID=A0A8T0I1H2_CERPU|nr:hypothetical protein KC19_5G098200 [Ceratodon purpureus]